MRVEPVTFRLWSRPLGWVDRRALRAAWPVFWTSRLLVFLSGVLAVLSFGNAGGWQGFDPLRLTSPFGYFGNLLAAPFARWDSVWYLTIARVGYGHEASRTAFFPLYPLLIRGLGYVTGSDLVAGVLISLVAFAVALIWLLLVRAVLGVVVLSLCLSSRHGLAPFGAEHAWFRHFAGPFGGVWAGVVAAWDGLRQLIHGPPPPVYFTSAGGNALSVAG